MDYHTDPEELQGLDYDLEWTGDNSPDLKRVNKWLGLPRAPEPIMCNRDERVMFKAGDNVMEILSVSCLVSNIVSMAELLHNKSQSVCSLRSALTVEFINWLIHNCLDYPSDWIEYRS
jgi:hypothetical protein